MIVQTYFFLVCVYFSVQLSFAVSGSILQQRFVKTNIRPTSSCVEVANQSQSFVHCSASCLLNHKDNVVFSRHVLSTRCVCCRRILTGSHYSDTEWITYKQGTFFLYWFPCIVLFYLQHLYLCATIHVDVGFIIMLIWF